MPPKQKLYSDFKPLTLREQIAKLIASEKLLRKISHDEQLRMISAHLLMLSYFELSEYERILRYLETSTEANNNLKSLIEALATRKDVNHSVASNCLHLLALKAECFLLTSEFTKGASAFN